ncbi:MAG: efflux RND transporter permease subunit [Candidatus Eremiobacteraeota bacterium]|nr:efflux RND transporter permease subunit [Candidatus Eremiobacteraeota bacterium]
MIAVIFLGYYGLRQLSIDLLPSFSFPLIFISETYPNVAPEEMETLIARPIEDAVSQVPGIQKVDSTSFEGVTTIQAQFNFGTNVDTAANDVREQLDRIKNRLPNDQNLQPIGIFKADPGQLPVLIVGVNAAGLTATALDNLVENTLIPQIEGVSGVGAALETGGVVREIRVEVDNQRLASLGIPLSSVINRVAQQNENVAGGIGREGGREYEIRVTGLIKDPKQLSSLVLASAKDGTPIYLGNVARIVDAGKEQRIIGRLNGIPSVGVTVSKQSDANTVAVVQSLYAKFADLSKTYPGLHFAPVYDQHFYIEDSINALKQNALIGALLAILVILFFLHSFRSTLVVALSIPTSVAGAFLAMYLAGFNLNIMTLGGLALAVGLIVDDAIVVLENIFRRVERGETQVVAAQSGAAQIYGAVMSSTVTVMIVFLPMLLVGGVASKIFQPFALVVVFAIGVSLLVSLSVVPMLAARFIRRSDVEESHVDPSSTLLARMEAWSFERFGRAYHRLESSYRKTLGWSLGHGAAVALIAIAAVIGGVAMLVSRGVEFLPASNTNYVTINYQLPTGTALALNNAFASDIERQLRADTDNVQDVYANIGASQNFIGFGTRPVSNSGQFFVTLKPTGRGSTRTLTTDAYVEKIRASFGKMPGVRAYPVAVDIVSRILSFATGASLGVEVNLYGPDLAKLSALGDAAVESLRNRIPGLINVRTSIDNSAPEMDVAVNRDRAAALGVPLSNIADTVATATNGTVASRYEEGGQQYDINVIYPENQRKSADNIDQLTITTPTGTVVPLAEVATVTFGKGPNQITRENKQRYIGIQGDVLGAPAGTVSKEVQQRLQAMQLPAGYRFDFAAGSETQNQTFASLGLALVLAIVLIYMLLAAKYESLWQPLVIMLTLPLAIVGVGLGLLVFRQSLGLTAFIGLLTLVGIVVKNAILLVEFTNQLRAQGLSTKEALMQAGPIRMRPILMTTSATSLGLLPLGLALQQGSETQAPLAAVVIGGLVTSTLLTLVIIPVAYYNAHRLVDRYMRTRFGRYAADVFGAAMPTNGRALDRSIDIDVREEEKV